MHKRLSRSVKVPKTLRGPIQTTSCKHLNSAAARNQRASLRARLLHNASSPLYSCIEVEMKYYEYICILKCIEVHLLQKMREVGGVVQFRGQARADVPTGPAVPSPAESPWPARPARRDELGHGERVRSHCSAILPRTSSSSLVLCS